MPRGAGHRDGGTVDRTVPCGSYSVSLSGFRVRRYGHWAPGRGPPLAGHESGDPGPYNLKCRFCGAAGWQWPGGWDGRAAFAELGLSIA
eukprot:756155-Hanusia_phi.AAC.8